MKKIIYFVLVASILCCTVACSRIQNADGDEINNDYNKDILSRIYEISNQTLDAESVDDSIKRNDIISTKRVLSKNKEAEEKTIIYVAGKSMNLTYQETYFYPLGDTEFHQYVIDGMTDSRVMVNKDGRVLEIVGTSIAKLDISPQESLESVQQKLEVALSDTVDFSLYPYIIPNTILLPDGTCTFYTFFYNNKLNGYQTDSVFIAVRKDGTVIKIGFSKPLPQLTEQDLQISKSYEDKILRMKLQDVYKIEDVDQLSYKVISSYVVLYDGELYVHYSLQTDVQWEDFDISDRYVWKLCDLLVPLQLLTKN